eukprot:scaffold18310_cov31-Tisochrysis_lutea.AAC.1
MRLHLSTWAKRTHLVRCRPPAAAAMSQHAQCACTTFGQERTPRARDEPSLPTKRVSISERIGSISVLISAGPEISRTLRRARLGEGEAGSLGPRDVCAALLVGHGRVMWAERSCGAEGRSTEARGRDERA